MYRIVCALLLLTPCAGAQTGHLLLRKPALSGTQIVFSYAGDLWSVAREGGDAKRLTTAPGVETDPVFSPDGSTIAFTGEYDGNVDVFVMPASGGVPRRLTYHPGRDAAVGWTPDGKRVLFVSARAVPNDGARLYTLPVEGGGLPEELPLPIALEGSYSADGSHLAYVPLFQWQEAWKRYRGGQTKKIWIANLADSSIVKIPREQFQRLQPHVGRRPDLLSFRPRRAGDVVLLRHQDEQDHTRHCQPRAGLQVGFRGTGRDRVRAIRRVAPVRPENRADQGRGRYAGGRSARTAAALCKRRQAAAECRYLAKRGARGVRGARRNPDGAGGEGRSAQPHEQHYGDGARTGVVARWAEHRLSIGRIGRVRAGYRQ
jgi:hypothetical protein